MTTEGIAQPGEPVNYAHCCRFGVNHGAIARRPRSHGHDLVEKDDLIADYQDYCEECWIPVGKAATGSAHQTRKRTLSA